MVRQTDFTVMQHFSLSVCAEKTQVIGDSKQLMNLNLSVASLSISLVLQHSELLQHLTRSLYVLPRAEEEAKHVLREVLTSRCSIDSRGQGIRVIYTKHFFTAQRTHCTQQEANYV